MGGPPCQRPDIAFRTVQEERTMDTGHTGFQLFAPFRFHPGRVGSTRQSPCQANTTQEPWDEPCAIIDTAAWLSKGTVFGQHASTRKVTPETQLRSFLKVMTHVIRQAQLPPRHLNLSRPRPRMWLDKRPVFCPMCGPRQHGGVGLLGRSVKNKNHSQNTEYTNSELIQLSVYTWLLCMQR